MKGGKNYFTNLALAVCGAVVLTLPSAVFQSAWARDVDYKNSEVTVHVTPGEPTEIQFPGKISGGFKRRQSALSIDRKDDALILFASEGLSLQGEAILVRLGDGRSYSVRVARSSADSPRDPIVRLRDERGAITGANEEEEPAYREKSFEYAPATQISGLMREMMLTAEFGKAAVPGYRESDRFKGEVVLNDGTLVATVERIFIGPNLWGYVIDVQNLLDTSQRINPASFRLDGTRAVSARNWELAPRPMNAEQQLAAKERTKIYIITKAKKTS